MNIIWTSIIIVSVILLIIFNPSIAFDTILKGSSNAIELAIKLWAIYAVWIGLLKIMEDTGLANKIAKRMKKIIYLLFGKVSPQSEEQIAINITSNLLVMGNACTPSGI